jgi:hypothetical protein
LNQSSFLVAATLLENVICPISARLSLYKSGNLQTHASSTTEKSRKLQEKRIYAMLSKSKYLSLVVALMLSSLQLAAPRMALETQEDYLNHLYLLVKDRPLRNGELNLLPDDSLPGFANTVRCVPESEEGACSIKQPLHACMKLTRRPMQLGP